MSIDLGDPSPSAPPGLHSADWRRLLLQLATYARRRLGGGCAERARELAQEAATRACEACRTAAASMHDVEAASYLLRGFVNGLVANERRRWRYTCEVAIGDERMASFAGDSTPEEAFLRHEQRAVALAAVRAELAEDAIGVRIVDLMEQGVGDAAAQACASGFAIGAIRNGRKRVFRVMRRMASEAD
jgi:hypothetical protein